MPYPKNGPDKQQEHMELCMPAVILWQQAYTADRVQDQEATPFSCLCALSSALAWHELKVGRSHMNWCHAFIYCTNFFFYFVKECCENRLHRHMLFVVCVCVCVYLYLRLEDILLAWYEALTLQHHHCASDTEWQLWVEKNKNKKKHVSTYNIRLAFLPVLHDAWHFQIKLIPLLIPSHKALSCCLLL